MDEAAQLCLASSLPLTILPSLSLSLLPPLSLLLPSPSSLQPAWIISSSPPTFPDGVAVRVAIKLTLDGAA
eukprot:5480300-Pyramimonas_sp.AAC.1